MHDDDARELGDLEGAAKDENISVAETGAEGVEPTPDILAQRYAYRELVGAGAAGKTYKSYDKLNGTTVAIKALRGQVDFKTRELFDREVATLKSIDVDGVPKFIDIVESPDDPDEIYLVQEYVDGVSLLKLIEDGKGGHFPEHAVRRFIGNMAHILHDLETKYTPPIVHRDIKPSNILYDAKADVYYLVDFGSVTNPQRKSMNSTIAGTQGYMAPEQLLGDATIQSDFYGLGATVLHMVTGISPADMPSDGFTRLYDSYIDELDLSRSLKSLIRRLLAPRAVDRPRSALEISALLDIRLPDIDETEDDDVDPKHERFRWIDALKNRFVSSKQHAVKRRLLSISDAKATIASIDKFRDGGVDYIGFCLSYVDGGKAYAVTIAVQYDEDDYRDLKNCIDAYHRERGKDGANLVETIRKCRLNCNIHELPIDTEKECAFRYNLAIAPEQGDGIAQLIWHKLAKVLAHPMHSSGCVKALSLDGKLKTNVTIVAVEKHSDDDPIYIKLILIYDKKTYSGVGRINLSKQEEIDFYKAHDVKDDVLLRVFVGCKIDVVATVNEKYVSFYYSKKQSNKYINDIHLIDDAVTLFEDDNIRQEDLDSTEPLIVPVEATIDSFEASFDEKERIMRIALCFAYRYRDKEYKYKFNEVFNMDSTDFKSMGLVRCVEEIKDYVDGFMLAKHIKSAHPFFALNERIIDGVICRYEPSHFSLSLKQNDWLIQWIIYSLDLIVQFVVNRSRTADWLLGNVAEAQVLPGWFADGDTYCVKRAEHLKSCWQNELSVPLKATIVGIETKIHDSNSDFNQSYEYVLVNYSYNYNNESFERTFEMRNYEYGKDGASTIQNRISEACGSRSLSSIDLSCSDLERQDPLDGLFVGRQVDGFIYPPMKEFFYFSEHQSDGFIDAIKPVVFDLFQKYCSYFYHPPLEFILSKNMLVRRSCYKSKWVSFEGGISPLDLFSAEDD